MSLLRFSLRGLLGLTVVVASVTWAVVASYRLGTMEATVDHLRARAGEMVIRDPQRVHTMLLHPGPAPTCDWRICVPQGRRATFYYLAGNLPQGMLQGPFDKEHAVHLFEFIGDGQPLTVLMTVDDRSRPDKMLVNFALRRELREEAGSSWRELRRGVFEGDASRYSFLLPDSKVFLWIHYSHVWSREPTHAISDEEALGVVFMKHGTVHQEEGRRVEKGLMFWAEIEPPVNEATSAEGPD